MDIRRADPRLFGDPREGRTFGAGAIRATARMMVKVQAQPDLNQDPPTRQQLRRELRKMIKR